MSVEELEGDCSIDDDVTIDSYGVDDIGPHAVVVSRQTRTIDADLVMAGVRLQQRGIRERGKAALQEAARTVDVGLIGPATAEVRILLTRIGRCGRRRDGRGCGY